MAIRKSSEKYECIDSGFCPFSGLEFENILPCIKMCIDNKKNISPCHIPSEYNTSKASELLQI